MAGHGVDVPLEELRVFEDVVIDSLENVVGGISLGLDQIGVIDEPLSERLDVIDFGGDVEAVDDVCKVFHCYSQYL